jgi:hypothetical protein
MHLLGVLGFPRRISDYGDLYLSGSGSISVGLALALLSLVLFSLIFIELSFGCCSVALGTVLGLIPSFSILGCAGFGVSCGFATSSCEQVVRNYTIAHIFTLNCSSGLVYFASKTNTNEGVGRATLNFYSCERPFRKVSLCLQFICFAFRVVFIVAHSV